MYLIQYVVIVTSLLLVGLAAALIIWKLTEPTGTQTADCRVDVQVVFAAFVAIVIALTFVLLAIKGGPE